MTCDGFVQDGDLIWGRALSCPYSTIMGISISKLIGICFFSPDCIMKRVGTGAWRLSHMTGGGSVLNRYEVGHTLESTLALDFTLMT